MEWIIKVILIATNILWLGYWFGILIKLSEMKSNNRYILVPITLMVLFTYPVISITYLI